MDNDIIITNLTTRNCKILGKFGEETGKRTSKKEKLRNRDGDDEASGDKSVCLRAVRVPFQNRNDYCEKERKRVVNGAGNIKIVTDENKKVMHFGKK